MNGRSDDPPTLQLPTFFPFRLNRLAVEVSTQLSEIYSQRFGLEIPEWRALVTVAANVSCTAQFIVEATHTHKTRISRAIAQLLEKGLLERTPNDSDRRERTLRLTVAGGELYEQLVPLVLQREQELLGCLEPTQRQQFLNALEQMERAFKLIR